MSPDLKNMKATNLHKLCVQLMLVLYVLFMIRLFTIWSCCDALSGWKWGIRVSMCYLIPCGWWIGKKKLPLQMVFERHSNLYSLSYSRLWGEKTECAYDVISCEGDRFEGKHKYICVCNLWEPWQKESVTCFVVVLPLAPLGCTKDMYSWELLLGLIFLL